MGIDSSSTLVKMKLFFWGGVQASGGKGLFATSFEVRFLRWSIQHLMLTHVRGFASYLGKPRSVKLEGIPPRFNTNRLLLCYSYKRSLVFSSCFVPNFLHFPTYIIL